MDTLRGLTYRALNVLALLPPLIFFLLDADIGREYAVGFPQKLRLILAFRRNARRLETLSTVREHVELAAAILRVPRSLEGIIVECGCYLGGSSVNLSLTCALAGRRLAIFDSFQGLPAPSEGDRSHFNLHSGVTDEYYEGRFAATLDTVKANIALHGNLDVCDFVEGFFEETLPQMNERVAMAFLDVDLVESLRPCLSGLWPNMQEGCRLYVHEARSLSLVSIFFTVSWWQEQFGENPPGFVGAGTGLPLSALHGSELGYAQKGTPIAAVAD